MWRRWRNVIVVTLTRALFCFFFSSRRRHTRFKCDWSSDVCSSDLVSLSTVNRAHMAYDHGGIKALKPKPIGGRMRENMTLAEEKALLARFAKAAGAGELLNIHALKAAYEQPIGHETSNITLSTLLARHGCPHPMPRP